MRVLLGQCSRPLQVCLVVAIASLLGVCAASADAIHLQDGSLIRGTILSIGGETVSVKTTYAGTINVSLKEVTGLDTDTGHDVSLRNGEVHSGLLHWSDGHQEILGADNTTVPIDIGNLAKSAPHPPSDNTAPSADWTGRIELSLTGDEGNTNKLNAMTAFTANRASLDDRLTLKLRAQYEENSGDVEKNEAAGLLHYEHDLAPNIFFFTHLNLEYDEFERIDFRARLAAGAGRFLVRNTRQDLRIFGGLGYEFERFAQSTNDTTPLMGGGYIYRLDVRDWLQYDSTLFFFSNLTEPGDVRLDADNSAELPLGKSSNWKVRLGVRNEYDSRPLDGIESLDTSYYLSLVYTWD